MAISLAFAALAYAQTTSTQGPSSGKKQLSGPAAQLPPRVYDSFRKEYPTAHVLKVEHETEAGAPVYEVTLEDQGVRRTVSYSEYGAVLEVEEVIPASAIPPNVQSAVQNQCPGCSITQAERSTRGNIVQYEMTLQQQGPRGGKHHRTMTFNTDGKLISTKK
jgi:hypothetical protein